MLENYKLTVKYTIDGETNQISNDDNTEHYSVEDSYKDGRLKISINPKRKISLIAISLEYKYNYKQSSKVYVNGYQSWSYSPEYSINDKMKGIMPIGRLLGYKFNSVFGDYQFKSYPKDKGIFHGYTYSYVRNGEDILLLGSLTERQGYTIINHNMIDNTIVIEKEVEGLVIDAKYDLYDIVEIEDKYEEAFDKYFALMNIKKPKIEHLAGYTSWYNYFGKIDENILMRDLEGMDKVKGYSQIFQIDDGYQSKVGDWLILKDDKFPNGMKYIADSIHKKGLLAGLWLAPFSCAKSSKLFNEHPEWLVKDENGNPILSGIAWGGSYTVDFYVPEARAYIKNVFDVVLNEWGFDMVKLDFLYSICLNPRNNKTRGTIMCEAMEFLRECVGDKLMLGCGVPLGPSFGVVDMCRISSDVDLKFKNKFYYYVGNSEIVNTRSAMNNSIFRRHLNHRAFVNDPDVFFLRDNNLRFNLQQKLLLAEINNKFGDVLFVSENIGDYNEKQLDVVKKAFTQSKAKIISAEYILKDSIEIIYLEDNAKYKWLINLKNGENEVLAI